MATDGGHFSFAILIQMGEREKGKETIDKGELFFLCHPGEAIFSGYGVTIEPGDRAQLVGLLMVDRPQPANPEWLKQVESIFGEYQLVPMTPTGERGIVCQMLIEPESQPHLCQFPAERGAAIQKALEPLLDALPTPTFNLRWSEEAKAWQSTLAKPFELPEEVRSVFEKIGYGCVSVEANIGVIHACHAADGDIDGFANKPVIAQWQLIQMPTAPLIRLNLILLDRPDNP